MKLIIVLLSQLLQDALTALAISGIISLIRMIFTQVKWGQFFFGALAIFLFLFLDGIYNWIQTIRLMRKDPVFREMTTRTGISWRDYKKMRK